MIRVVLDTNVVVSALLFEGTAAALVPLWRTSRFLPLVSRPMLAEYVRVLAYPEFRLTPDEIEEALDEILPHAELVARTRPLRVVKADPADDRFLECAVAGKVDFLVSGDRHLVTLGHFRRISIVPPARFLEYLREAR